MHSQGADNKNRMRADPIKSIFSVGCCHLMPLSLPHHSLLHVPTPLLVLSIAVMVSEEGRKMWGTETWWSRLCWKVACSAEPQGPVQLCRMLDAQLSTTLMPSMCAGCTPTSLQASHHTAGFILLLRLPQAATDLNPRYFC